MRKTTVLLARLLSPLLLLSTYCAGKDYLVITSDPPGAKVEIGGDVVGKTPYKIEIPSQYLHGTRNVFGLKHVLAQQLHLRLILDGYLPKEEDLARGPFKWIALNGTYHGDYFLLKTETFNFALEKPQRHSQEASLPQYRLLAPHCFRRLFRRKKSSNVQIPLSYFFAAPKEPVPAFS